jgi:polyphosphate kinase 2
MALDKNTILTNEDIAQISSHEDLMEILSMRNQTKLETVLNRIQYEEELKELQIELLKLQRWIIDKKQRVVIIFEGRDAAGKGGTIRRFQRYLRPRYHRVVALNKPTDLEKGQWYFRRHVKELPNEGEMVFFDRSWYNRAVVEPVMGFCTKSQYTEFIQQVPEFEHMLYENGVHIIKFWFAISREEQSRRFKSRKTNPLKQWKLSPVDLKSQALWDDFTYYKNEMFSKTHTNFAPWIIVGTDEKKEARLESIRYVLSRFNYSKKEDTKISLYPDPNVVMRFHRSVLTID